MSIDVRASSPTPTGVTRRSSPGLIAAALILGGLAMQLAVPGSGTRRALFGLAVAALALILTRLSLPRSELVARRYISFGNAFLVYVSVAYGLALFGPELPAVARVVPGVTDRTNLVGIPVGIFAFFVGYRASGRRFGLGQIGSIVAPQSSTLVGPQVLAAVYLSTVLVRGFSLATGRLVFQQATAESGSVDAIGQIANDYGGFGNAIIALAVLGYATKKIRGYLLVPIVGVPIELAFGALSGRKSFFLLAGLSAVLVLFFIGRLRARTIVFGAIAALLFIFPVIDGFRLLLASERQQGPVAAGEFVGLFNESLGDASDLWLGSPGETFADTRDRALERLRDVDRYALAVDTHRAVPFEPIEVVPRNAVIRTVPRVIWPGKPVIRYGFEVSTTYYQLPSQVVTATSLSLVGDAYRYGGHISVVGLMAVFGWILRRWDIAFDHTKSVWLLAAFGPLSDIVKFAEHARVLPAAIRTTLILAVFMKLVLRRPPSERLVRPVSSLPRKTA